MNTSAAFFVIRVVAHFFASPLFHLFPCPSRIDAGGRSPGSSGPSRTSPGFNPSSGGAGGTTPPSGVSTLARQNAPRGADYDDRTLLINRGGGGGGGAAGGGGGGDGVNGGRRGVRNDGYAQVRRLKEMLYFTVILYALSRLPFLFPQLFLCYIIVIGFFSYLFCC